MGDRIRFDVPMASCISLCVGGPADAVANPANRVELASLLRLCAQERVRHHILGGGFNTLATDARVPGVVIRLSKFRRLEERPGNLLRAEAGVSHSQISRFCVSRGFAGLEFGAGIPGTIGGWLAMNAGIPEREVKDVVHEIEVMSPTGRNISHLGRGALCFVYRALHGLAPGSLILSALLEIGISTRERVRAEVDRNLAKRMGTQPLNVPSCGSVFKNPPGDHAGRLIESVGLKGHRIGGAQISPVHANFIANTGNACAADVLALIEMAQVTVHEQTGLHLETEVHVLGGIS
jgi:UDP-N-acetylmuramate dehydrogenase